MNAIVVHTDASVQSLIFLNFYLNIALVIIDCKFSGNYYIIIINYSVDFDCFDNREGEEFFCSFFVPFYVKIKVVKFYV